MKNTAIFLPMMITMFFSYFSCGGQERKPEEGKNDRRPCVAGQFYPADPQELKNELKALFAAAKPKSTQNVLAIVSPHAGYVFSGSVAATSFNQIDAEKKYDHIFVIGSSHRTYFDGASIYSEGDFLMPLGTVKVDTAFARKLIREHKEFVFRNDAHQAEHSLEVQLPFLQYVMKTDYNIVPIVIASQSEKTIKKMAEALKPYFNDRNLFIISSDFSHYPSYNNATEADKTTADAIALNSPEAFLAVLEKNEKKNIPNLATSMCGWSSMLMMLYMTENQPGVNIIPVEYRNSGDAGITNKNEVVGYWSIAITGQAKHDEETGFDLTDREKQMLLHLARETVEKYVTFNKIPDPEDFGLTEGVKTEAGAFVTLHKKGELRGCIGSFNPEKPLYQVVQEMAISAATKDYRFLAVEPSELKELDYEISVLTPMRKIESIDEIELGRHGIYIKKGMNAGTFLPQVATETGWNKEQFLGHCSRDKAGIGWDGWRQAEIYIYEALVFGEKDLKP